MGPTYSEPILFIVYTSNSLYKRPVLEPDVLTKIASIHKYIQNYINLQKRKKKKKKKQVFITFRTCKRLHETVFSNK